MSDYICPECATLELRGYEYEVVTDGTGEHIQHVVVRSDKIDPTDLKED